VSPLTCNASVSNPTPADYSTVEVIVHTGVPGASVTATAHYKTTDTTHNSSVGGDGVADIPFRISRATPGYTVTVDVTVAAGGASRDCSTGFTSLSA
jgi:competence protein ComEC